MNRLLIVLFGIVSTVSVSILLLLLYRYANENVIEYRESGVPDMTKQFGRTRKSDDIEKRWLESLATKKRPTFSYAVSEMEVDLPLKQKPIPKHALRLILTDLDDYKLFCIRQIFKKHGIEYAMFRKKSRGVVMIDDLNREKLSRIVDLVKEYDISIKTENYIKE